MQQLLEHRMWHPVLSEVDHCLFGEVHLHVHVGGMKHVDAWLCRVGDAWEGILDLGL